MCKSNWTTNCTKSCLMPTTNFCRRGITSRNGATKWMQTERFRTRNDWDARMKRWRVIIVSFAALGIIVFCWISIIASRPPTFAGKSLSYWLEQYRNSGQSDVPDENDWQYEWLGDESLAAMRAMGPKAVSYLLRTAFYQKSDTAISRTYYKVVSKLPQSWNLPGQEENPARLSFVAYVALEHLRPLQELVLPAI